MTTEFHKWWEAYRTTVNVGVIHPLEVARSAYEAATITDREACARMLELRDSELLLMAGEMTAQELRTVKAVLSQRANAIRMRSNAKNQGDSGGFIAGGSPGLPG